MKSLSQRKDRRSHLRPRRVLQTRIAEQDVSEGIEARSEDLQIVDPISYASFGEERGQSFSSSYTPPEEKVDPELIGKMLYGRELRIRDMIAAGVVDTIKSPDQASYDEVMEQHEEFDRDPVLLDLSLKRLKESMKRKFGYNA